MKTNIKSLPKDDDVTAEELCDIDTLIVQHSDDGGCRSAGAVSATRHSPTWVAGCC